MDDFEENKVQDDGPEEDGEDIEYNDKWIFAVETES